MKGTTQTASLSLLLRAAATLLLAGAYWFGGAVYAQDSGSVTISCPAGVTESIDSCTITGDETLLGSAFVDDLSSIQSCTFESDLTTLSCTTSTGSPLSCSVDATGFGCSNDSGSYSCGFETDESFSCTVSGEILTAAAPAPGGEDPAPGGDEPTGDNPVQDAIDSIASTGPSQSIGDVIAAVCPNGVANSDLQRDCNALVGAAINGDSSAIGALLQVTPDDVSAPVDASQASIGVQTRNVASRLAALRSGSTGLSVEGLSLYQDGRKIGAQELATIYAGQHGGGAGDEDSIFASGKLGVFINGIVVGGEKDGTNNEDGFEYDTRGITAGLDYRISEAAVAGIAIGFSKGDTDVDNDGGGLDSDGMSVTVYGSYAPQPQWYVDGSLSYGSSDFDQDRNIRYGLSDGTSVNQTASADFDGDQLALTLGGGYEFNKNGLSYGPLAQLQYVKGSVDGYNEELSSPSSNGSGWGVSIQDQDFRSLTLSVGGQVSYASSQSWGVLVPQARVMLVHEFEDDPEDVRGSFIGDSSGQVFSLSTDEPDSNYAEVGLGVSALFADGKSGFLYFEKVIGYEDLDHYSVVAGFRMEF